MGITRRADPALGAAATIWGRNFTGRCGRFLFSPHGRRRRLNEPMPFLAATRQLRRRLGPKIVAIDEAARFAASFDSSKISFLPEAVIKPRREADIGVALE